MNCTKSARGPLFLDLEYKWHPSMGTAKSFQDAITLPAPEMVKNIAYPGIFYRSVRNCPITLVVLCMEIISESMSLSLEI